MSHTEWVLIGGAVIGLLFGMVGQYSGFCLMRGLKNQWQSGDGRKLRAFAMAMAVALAGTQILSVTTGINLGDAHYAQRSISWLLIPLGGVLFGLGMVLANGCGARALVLLGTGNLRSLVVLLCLGVSAYMAMSGVLADARLGLADLTRVTLPAVSLPGLINTWGLPVSVGTGLTSVVLVALPAFYALSHSGFRRSVNDQIGGVVIGLLVVAGWYVTGVLGNDIFDPVNLASLTFVAPVGESLHYLMISTGISLTFGVAVVGGIVVGSLFTALIRRQFVWQGFDSPSHLRRSVIGALMMGVGGVMALGCSIGQGLTGYSTLALTSYLAIAGILAGAWLGIWGPLHKASGPG